MAVICRYENGKCANRAKNPAFCARDDAEVLAGNMCAPSCDPKVIAFYQKCIDGNDPANKVKCRSYWDPVANTSVFVGHVEMHGHQSDIHQHQ